jgi:hypothetical protein
VSNHLGFSHDVPNVSFEHCKYEVLQEVELEWSPMTTVMKIPKRRWSPMCKETLQNYSIPPMKRLEMATELIKPGFLWRFFTAGASYEQGFGAKAIDPRVLPDMIYARRHEPHAACPLSSPSPSFSPSDF